MWLKSKAYLLGRSYRAIIPLLILVVSCGQPDVLEKTVPMAKHEWLNTYRPWISFDITDTADFYNVFAVIRHMDTYKYNNLLLRFDLIRPGDTAVTQRLNVPVGTQARWIGDTLNEIIEMRAKLNTRPLKLGYGTNAFVLQQMMPDNPLEGVTNLGIRLEKTVE